MKRVFITKIFCILLLSMSSQLFSRVLVDVPDNLLVKTFLSYVKTHKLVEEETEVCCESLHSKIDSQVTPELISIESKLDEWIGPLTETIDSKVDALQIFASQDTCQMVDSKIDNIIFQNLNEIESKIDALEVGACPTSKGTVITGSTYTISDGGLYVLNANTQSCVTISANEVTIDLCGFTLSCDSGDAVIEVEQGHRDIKIINGKVKGADGLTNDGILVNQNCQLIMLSRLTIYSCDNGINFLGAADPNFIKACTMQRCIFDGCNKGAFLQYTKKSVFQDCRALNCIQAGFEQEYSEFNVYEKCKALETANNVADERAVGFSSSGGAGNLYTECVAEGTQKMVESNFGQDAIGFLLTGTLGDMEAETKIINCIANTTSVLLSDTLADAYGIKIEPVLMSGDDLLATVTGADYVNADYIVYSVNWSLDGRYLAVVGVNGYTVDAKIRVYSFKGSSSSLKLISSVDDGINLIETIDWSPDGRFLAIGGNKPGNQIQVYSFDGSRLLFIDSINHGGWVRSVNWSPDGKFLAIVGIGINIYSFDGSHFSSVPISSVSYGGTSADSVNWSPDGKYLAVGGANLSSGDEIRIYSFDGSHLSLAPISSVNYGAEVRFVEWSPNGRYLAIRGLKGGSEIQVYSFDGLLSFLPIVSINFTAALYTDSICWSPDGNYLAVGGDSGNGVYVYSFDSLNLVSKGFVDYGGDVLSVNWSSDGGYLAVGGYRYANIEQIKIYGVMDTTLNCLIDNNKICNTGNDNFGGVGILASGENVYIRNILYANDVHFNKGVIPQFGSAFGPLLVGSPGMFDNVFVDG